ncbi:MAG: ATP-binding protein [Pseudomonadota bacterium]
MKTLLGPNANRRAWVLGLGTGFVYFLVAVLCLAISRFDATLASVWLPNAIAIAVLFVVRLRTQLPALFAIALASLAANVFAGTAIVVAAVFTLGNLTTIILVTWLTRRACGGTPDLSDLSHLGFFLQYGGVMGPISGALIAAPILGSDVGAIWAGGSAWFLADSMGIILIVPAVLLIARIWHEPTFHLSANLLQALIIAGIGLAAAYLVFSQSSYPLLFLIPPVTLLVALRLGTVGTALFVPGLAIIAATASFAGQGPIAHEVVSEITRMNLVQAFIAANFLTGLPIAAILAGRKRMTDELEQGRRELALLTEGITDAVMMINREGVCTYASPSVREVLGHPPEDFLGWHVADRSHADAHDRIMSVLDNLLSGKCDKERLTYRRLLDDDEGHPVFIEADCAVIGDTANDCRDGIVMSARDVTERVELELLLTRARRSAEKAASAKSEFLANMSHEIRTPMNGVLGFAELLREGGLSEENRRHADMIIQSGRSMMMLLNDILDLSKIEAGQIGITDEPVDLLTTVSECAALYRPSAEKKGLKLHFSMSEACRDLTGAGTANASPPWIKTDGLRLRQVILNLVGNAVKFTEKGQIEIKVFSEKEELYIEVQDTGIGISEERLHSIFAPFTQGEGDTARRYGGTGLGLSISRQLAELLGGTIEVQSEAGEGSTFRLTLPANYAEPILPECVQDEHLEPSMLTRSASILLVEDHDVNRLLVSEMLERCGQSVATAHDGNEAIAMVIDSIMRGKPFDLILMDIQMPGCDGYAATRAIRMEGIAPDELPIIALTANAFPEDLTAARDAGMQAHLAKPLVFSDLARALQRWLPTRIIEREDSPENVRNIPPSGDLSYFSDDQSLAPPPSLTDPPVAAEIVDISRDPSTRPPKIGEISLPETQIEERRKSSLSQFHSPSLIRRWSERRREAVEAVRNALGSGSLGNEGGSPEQCEHIAKLVHKLAGTAAIFGEAELGDQAAALEHALRMELPGHVREELASELLSVADDPADTLAEISS